MGGISVQAQVRLGVKAGVNLATASLKGDLRNNIKTDNLTGFQAGPILEATIPGLGLGFDAAVLYSQEGFKFSVNDILDETYKLNNLEIPVNLKYKLSLLKTIGIYGTAGPYINLKLSDKLQNQFQAKSFGAGLNFGAGVELLNHLQVGVNYKMGLTNDYSSIDNNNISNLIEGKTTIWSITATFLF
ncbi:membrane protein [Bacteroidia bacterium]|nr:membrane protein [Bacteroidia bacterium]